MSANFHCRPWNSAKRPAELLAHAGVLARPLVAIAAERERPRGVAEPLDVEARHLLLEAAGAEQHVLGRDAAVLEMQLAPLLAAHELLRRADGEARRAALDQHRADAADAGPVAHVDQKDRGLRAEGREHLGAVDDVVLAVRLGAGLEVGHGGAGVRLAHAETDHLRCRRGIRSAISSSDSRCRIRRRCGSARSCRTAPRRRCAGTTAAVCSMAITASISEPPWPPSASGMVMPIRPCWLISLATSNGNRGSCARLSASFSRCACANLRDGSRRTASALR